MRKTSKVKRARATFIVRDEAGRGRLIAEGVEPERIKIARCSGEGFARFWHAVREDAGVSERIEGTNPEPITYI